MFTEFVAETAISLTRFSPAISSRLQTHWELRKAVVMGKLETTLRVAQNVGVLPEEFRKPYQQIIESLEELQRQLTKNFAGIKRSPGSHVFRIAEELISLKFLTYGLDSVPPSLRMTYAAALDFVNLIWPEHAKTVRNYQPRRLFRDVAAEIESNPMALVDLDKEQRRQLAFIVRNGGGLGKIDKKHPLISRLPTYLEIAQLIEPEAIAFHQKAIPWLVRNVYYPERQESDQAFIERILTNFMHVYGIQTTCKVNLRDTGATYASAGQWPDPKDNIHYFEFNDFDKHPNRKEKFCQVIHEALHVFRSKLQNDPNYKIPLNLPFDSTESQPLNGKAVVRVGRNDPEIERLSPPTSNVKMAMAAFGEAVGYSKYREEAWEREAKGGEYLAAAEMRRQEGDAVLETMNKWEFEKVVDIDLHPEKIDRSFNIRAKLPMLEAPEIR